MPQNGLIIAYTIQKVAAAPEAAIYKGFRAQENKTVREIDISRTDKAKRDTI